MANLIVALYIALVGSFNDSLHGECGAVEGITTNIEVVTDANLILYEDCSVEIAS